MPITRPIGSDGIRTTRTVREHPRFSVEFRWREKEMKQLWDELTITWDEMDENADKQSIQFLEYKRDNAN
jgi:hypothetical protein